MANLNRMLLVGGIAILCQSCGSSDEAEPAPAEAGGALSETYCDAASEYLEATSSIDPSTPESVISSFAVAAEAARAAADAAPAEVREAHDHLASAAEDLVTGLSERAPRTMAELDAANSELVAQLTTEYGDLELETRQAQDFAARECGLVFP